MSRRHTQQDATGVLLANDRGEALVAAGTTVPTAGHAGYSKGCLFLDVDASGGAQVLANEGTASSASFKMQAANRVVVRHPISAASVDDWIFIADRAYTVVSIKEVHSVAGTDAGSVTLDIRKVTADGQAPGATAGASVIELLSSAFNLKSTANTVVSGTLAVTSIAAGDRIGANFAGVLTALAGGVVVIELQPA
jgi:hypothetical protein